jgi:hypothetical protein
MRTIAVVGLVTMAGCAPTDFERWNKAACDGDPKAFWALVSQSEIQESLAVALVEDGDAKGKLADVAAEKAWESMREVWDEDVRKGASGDLCAMRADGDPSESGEQRVTRKSGKPATLRFRGGKLVSYRAR